MKLIEKRIAFLFLVLSMLSFSACEKTEPKKTSKYKFSANNGFSAYFDDSYNRGVYWIKDGKIAKIDLDEVLAAENYLDYNFLTIPQDIDSNNIIGLVKNIGIVSKEKNSIFAYDSEINKKMQLFELPKEKYISVLNIMLDIVVLSEKELAVYSVSGFDTEAEKFIYASPVNYPLKKEYEAAFYLGGNRIGLVNGNEIDFMQVNLSDFYNDETDFDIGFIDEFASLPDHVTLDKQYDAYVGLYDNGWCFDGKTAYLGCIEGNKLRFYNIKRGQFATIPFVGTELTCTF